jgi:hypothetical protein
MRDQSRSSSTLTKHFRGNERECASLRGEKASVTDV